MSELRAGKYNRIVYSCPVNVIRNRLPISQLFLLSHISFSIAILNRYLSDLVSDVQNEGSSGESKEAPTVPSIRVVIVKGAEDVTIKIADKAGGIPRSDARKVWSFAHTNMDESTMEKEMETDFETDEFTGSAIRGFGLPLARIYARYFGGELTIKSMEGFGVDAYLYLPVLGAACENLPQRVTQSPGNLDSNPSDYY